MVGNVQWCPRITKAIARIQYWKGIINEGHIGAKYLQWVAKKGGLLHHMEHLQLGAETIKAKIQQAYKAYQRLKNDTGRQDTWIAQLIEAQAQDQQVSKKSLWKKIRATKKIQSNARMIKTALAESHARQGLNHVIGPHPEDMT